MRYDRLRSFHFFYVNGKGFLLLCNRSKVQFQNCQYFHYLATSQNRRFEPESIHTSCFHPRNRKKILPELQLRLEEV